MWGLWASVGSQCFFPKNFLNCVKFNWLALTFFVPNADVLNVGSLNKAGAPLSKLLPVPPPHPPSMTRSMVTAQSQSPDLQQWGRQETSGSPRSDPYGGGGGVRCEVVFCIQTKSVLLHVCCSLASYSIQEWVAPEDPLSSAVVPLKPVEFCCQSQNCVLDLMGGKTTHDKSFRFNWIYSTQLLQYFCFI